MNRVFNPDLRSLVSEAYRCYASGSARVAMAAHRHAVARHGPWRALGPVPGRGAARTQYRTGRLCFLGSSRGGLP
ncbi:hypothetical protein GCM10010358_79280 [Streptomyces minutiscleroticus]|uniref:Uncharacterized protein n=1 Tax=Streptomyces minutiscleroticus TaxID=68238 RepID=A0A918UA83_9ACTN|nr:hypothetical protein GCM10010358_79280 [Streptomyces minutiscleroticus]